MAGWFNRDDLIRQLGNVDTSLSGQPVGKSGGLAQGLEAAAQYGIDYADRKKQQQNVEQDQQFRNAVQSFQEYKQKQDAMRQDKMLDFTQGKADADQQYRQDKFAYDQSRDQVLDDQWQKQYDLSSRIADMNNAFKERPFRIDDEIKANSGLLYSQLPDWAQGGIYNLVTGDNPQYVILDAQQQTSPSGKVYANSPYLVTLLDRNGDWSVKMITDTRPSTSQPSTLESLADGLNPAVRALRDREGAPVGLGDALRTTGSNLLQRLNNSDSTAVDELYRNMGIDYGAQ